MASGFMQLLVLWLDLITVVVIDNSLMNNYQKFVIQKFHNMKFSRHMVSDISMREKTMQNGPFEKLMRILFMCFSALCIIILYRAIKNYKFMRPALDSHNKTCVEKCHFMIEWF